MDIVNLLSPEGVIPNLHATSKKQALQELAKHAAALTGLHERTIFDVLLERERLGRRSNPSQDREGRAAAL